MMDLLEIFPHYVCVNIFKFLDVKDLLNASLVSKGWYEFIGHSKECMYKMVFRHFYFDNTEYEALFRSTRLYKNASFLYPISMHKEEKNQMIEKFAGSLEHITTSHDCEDVCELPNLKILEFKPVAVDSVTLYANGLLAKSPALEKLQLDPKYTDEASIDVLKDCLKKMNKLNDLETVAEILEGWKNVKYPFKLERIFLSPYRKYYNPSQELREFLLTHRATVQSLSCGFADYKHIMTMAQFPRLKHIQFTDSFDPMLAPLPRNENIQSFWFWTPEPFDASCLKIILESAPKIKALIF